MLAILEKQKCQYEFYFELDDENKDIPKLLNFHNFTVFPKNGLFRDIEWVKKLPIIHSNDWQMANFILVGNVTSAQTFRKVLKAENIAKIRLHGYWLEGKKGL